MKYRNHLDTTGSRPLRVAPRRHMTPVPKITATKPTIETPLIDVHDTPSRFEDFKDFSTAVTQPVISIISSSLAKVRQTFLRILKNHRKQLYRYYREFKTTKRISRSAILTLALYFLIVSGSYIAFLQFGRSDRPISATLGDNASQQRPATTETPDFQTVLPKGSSISSLGGWNRVSPPDRDPVFAFVDTLDERQITISQQPLPRTSADSPADTIRSIAYDFNAKDRHTADDGTVFYVGTSSKGPQSIITGKNNLLLLIKAPTAIDIDSWSRYIASLQ